jgi:hypothetical protein
MESTLRAIADAELPQSPRKIFETFLAGFKSRKTAPGAAVQENGELAKYFFDIIFLRKFKKIMQVT